MATGFFLFFEYSFILEDVKYAPSRELESCALLKAPHTRRSVAFARWHSLGGIRSVAPHGGISGRCYVVCAELLWSVIKHLVNKAK